MSLVHRRHSIVLFSVLLLLSSILLLSAPRLLLVAAQNSTTNATTTTTDGANTTTTTLGGNTTTTTEGNTTTTTITTTTTTNTPAPPPPRFPILTRAPRATSSTTTSVTTTTTLPPTTTLAADISATYTQVDVFFSIFFDQYLQDYLNLFKDLSGVSLARLRVIEYMGYPSASMGDGREAYMMTMQFLQPLTPADPLMAETASAALADALNSRGDDRIARHGITHAERVGQAKRLTEDNGRGVNWMWLILWFLTMFLIIFSIGALFRKRAAETVEDESGGGGATGGMSVPADDSHLQRERLDTLVEKAEAKRKEREARRMEEIKYAPGPELFASTLEYEHRVRLPPEGGIRQSKRQRGGAAGAGAGDAVEMQGVASPEDGGGAVRDAATADNRSTNSGDRNTPPEGEGLPPQQPPAGGGAVSGTDAAAAPAEGQPINQSEIDALLGGGSPVPAAGSAGTTNPLDEDVAGAGELGAEASVSNLL